MSARRGVRAHNAKPIPPEGSRFGRLTVIGTFFHRGGNNFLPCRCDCGTERAVRVTALRSGNSTSCGCIAKEKAVATAKARRTHGRSRTPEYQTWRDMLNRCYRPATKAYARYGSRGITVCDRWRASFEAFFADMGARPDPGHSIDRIDNDGNYEPGNCRWATYLEQCRNKSQNRVLEIRGERKTVVEWSERSGNPEYLICNRLHVLGWDPESAVFTPPGGRRP